MTWWTTRREARARLWISTSRVCSCRRLFFSTQFCFPNFENHVFTFIIIFLNVGSTRRRAARDAAHSGARTDGLARQIKAVATSAAFRVDLGHFGPHQRRGACVSALNRVIKLLILPILRRERPRAPELFLFFSSRFFRLEKKRRSLFILEPTQARRHDASTLRGQRRRSFRARFSVLRRAELFLLARHSRVDPRPAPPSVQEAFLSFFRGGGPRSNF